MDGKQSKKKAINRISLSQANAHPIIPEQDDQHLVPNAGLVEIGGVENQKPCNSAIPTESAKRGRESLRSHGRSLVDEDSSEDVSEGEIDVNRISEADSKRILKMARLLQAKSLVSRKVPPLPSLKQNHLSSMVDHFKRCKLILGENDLDVNQATVKTALIETLSQCSLPYQEANNLFHEEWSQIEKCLTAAYCAAGDVKTVIESEIRELKFDCDNALQFTSYIRSLGRRYLLNGGTKNRLWELILPKLRVDLKRDFFREALLGAESGLQIADIDFNSALSALDNCVRLYKDSGSLRPPFKPAAVNRSYAIKERPRERETNDQFREREEFVNRHKKVLYVSLPNDELKDVALKLVGKDVDSILLTNNNQKPFLLLGYPPSALSHFYTDMEKLDSAGLKLHIYNKAVNSKNFNAGPGARRN